jgi:putative YhbY family RNA-binding protein
MPISLTAKERARLKARAHALEPIVQVGQAGASDAVIAEVDRALAVHGLIKIRLAGDRDERKALVEVICERSGAAPVQAVGRVATLWRPRPEDEDAD